MKRAILCAVAWWFAAGLSSGEDKNIDAHLVGETDA
jgi:hypothetical protein